MALAKRCDVCRKFFADDKNTIGIRNCFELSSRNSGGVHIPGSEEKYDCCPDCMGEILKTIKYLKDKPEVRYE